MRTYAWVAAALAVALTTGCKDRDRRDADDRVEATGERAGDEIQEGADRTGDAVEDAADDAGDATDDAADKVGDAADDAGDAAKDAADATGIATYSYERRDEFRAEVNEHLARMDKELAELRRGVNDNAAESYTKAVAEAREARAAVARNLDRLSGATATTWDDLRGDVRESLDALDRQLRALRPDAKPMGGTGPS